MRLLSHIGDILAIPFFTLMVFYFYNMEDKSVVENILYVFSISGLILDIFFTYVFLCKRNKSICLL